MRYTFNLAQEEEGPGGYTSVEIASGSGDADHVAWNLRRLADKISPFTVEVATRPGSMPMVYRGTLPPATDG